MTNAQSVQGPATPNDDRAQFLDHLGRHTDEQLPGAAHEARHFADRLAVQLEPDCGVR
jgi:hypothetical protein